MPSPTPRTIQTTAAPKTMLKVTGARWVMISVTGWLLRNE
jgi:hypothetical protein